MKKLALFDIDGVIYEGHLILDSIQDQEKIEFIKTGLWNKILDLLSKYKKGELNYKQTADLMLESYALSLKDKDYNELADYSLNLIKKRFNCCWRF